MSAKNLHLSIYFSLLFIVLSGCLKLDGPNISDKPQADLSLKVEIIKGANQTDTVGNTLKDSIVVKLSKEGKPLVNYRVKFPLPGCDADSAITKTTGAAGTVTYSWTLGGAAGKQLLKAAIYNSTNAVVDSVTLTATALPTSRGWLYSACTPPQDPGFIYKFTTGRLISYFLHDPRIYISDDNAMTWHPVASNHSFEEILYMAVSEKNEIFINDNYKGLYYSADGGKTWELHNPPGTQPQVYNVVYTPGKKLVVDVLDEKGIKHLFISTNQGRNWIDAPDSGPKDVFVYIVERSNGDLFLVTLNAGSLYSLTNNATKWNTVYERPVTPYSAGVTGLAADGKGNIFIAKGSGYDQSIYYISSDGGQTFTKLPIPTNIALTEFLSFQTDNNLYSYEAGVGIFKIDALYNKTQAAPTGRSAGGSYILANNGSLVFSTGARLPNYYYKFAYTVK